MLGISKEVYRGILFLRMKGKFTKETTKSFKEELDNLLYKQGLHYFVLNFKEVECFDALSFSILESQLCEIYLNCGKVAICGIDSKKEQRTLENDNLYFVQNELDACHYLYL